MTTDDTPRIIHDTLTIISVNDAACRLFGADEQDLVDQRLVHGVVGDDMQFLADLRLKTIRELGEMQPQDLPFTRLDKSIFWARCKTTKNADGTYTTEMVYLYEY